MAYRNGSNLKQVLEACQMAFNGRSVKDIAGELGVPERKVYAWRKTEEYKQFELELVSAYKRQLETEAISAAAEAS